MHLNGQNFQFFNSVMSGPMAFGMFSKTNMRILKYITSQFFSKYS